MLKITFFILTVYSLCVGQAQAWGRSGHQITGHIAEKLLTNEARIRLNALIPAADLAEIAVWMDDERLPLMRSIRGSNKWHYINMPICNQKEWSDACSQGDCITARIEQYRRVLSSPISSVAEKVFSVRVLVHLIGDLHQPLHVADNYDRGGNDVLIVQTRTNLHSEWDTRLVQKITRGKNLREFSLLLLEKHRPQIEEWNSGTHTDWALESKHLASSFVYAALPDFSCNNSLKVIDQLPAEYVDRAKSVVELRLVMAAVRVAHVLNAAFK